MFTVEADGIERADLRTRALLDALTDGYGYSENGIVLEVNARMCELTGITAEQLIGSPVPFTAWPGDDPGRLQRIVEDAKSGLGASEEFEISRPDGTRRTVVLTCRPVRDACGGIAGYVSVLRDVTTERAGQAEREAGWELSEQTLSQAQLGSWSWDLDGNGTERVRWSRQMRALLGFDDSVEPTWEAYLSRVHADDLPSMAEFTERVLEGHSEELTDYRVLRPDGTVRYVRGTAQATLLPDGRVQRVWGSVQDVTELALRERALAASEEQFRLTFQHSPIGMALVSVDGLVTAANHALAVMLGYSPDDLISMGFSALTHPDDLEADTAQLEELLRGERTLYQLDKRYLLQDGSVAWASLHVSLVRDAEGNPSHFISQIVDISQRQRDADLLAAQAHTDPLTGLGNRRAWEKALHRHLGEVTAGGGPLVVGLLDFDHFKSYNDAHGHPAGDELLATTARAWTELLAIAAPDAALARIGGEEFAVALPGFDPARAHGVLEAMLAEVGNGQTVSAGLTPATPDDDPTSVLTRADAALYAAKHRGRNRCEVLLAF